MPTCSRPLGRLHRGSEKGRRKKKVDKSRRVHRDACMCVFLSVTAGVCASGGMLVQGQGGLSGWIRQKPGVVLCTIRIKVAISGCYLLRDALCSQF